MTTGGTPWSSSRRDLLFRRLFPFDSGRRLRTYVIDHAVYAGDLVYDATAHTLEQIIRKPGPVRSHRVVACHRSQDDRMGVSPGIPHDTDAADIRRERRERLPRLLVHSR